MHVLRYARRLACGWWRAHNARVFFQLRLHAILGSEELSCRVGEIGWQRQASPLGSGVKGSKTRLFFSFQVRDAWALLK